MRSVIASVGILLVAAVYGPAFPEEMVDRVVANRQSSMKAMAEAAKTISGIFDGKLDYDAASFKAAAEIIRQHSGAMINQFPADSLGAPSAAKVEIELYRDEFAALARHLESLANGLSTAADAAPNGITAAMRMVPGTGTWTGSGSSLIGKRSAGVMKEDLSKMPAEHMFHLVLQNCTSCHAKFRERQQ